MGKKKIILTDDDITNLSVGRDALSGEYEVFTVPSGEKLLAALEKVLPDLILLDVEMPEMNGYDTLKLIKAKNETADIPVIFLTAKNDEGSELEGLSLGAVDYISKPFSPSLLLKRIEVHLTLEEQKHIVEKQKQELQKYNHSLEDMVRQKTETILELQNDIMETIAELVECRDESTGGHISRTSKYLKILIDALLERGLFREETASWDIHQMVLSAQLHDVGKIAIDDSILRKPAKLNAEEFEEMKKHTVIGGEIIKRIQKDKAEKKFLDYAMIFTLYHHEKWDGSGYPFGTAGEKIPLPARLMAIIDVYDALVSERVYKKAFTHEQAMVIIKAGRGTQFDPVLTDLFLSVLNTN
jgi:putative two-component system response regulator